jgi:hypothetical protein
MNLSIRRAVKIIAQETTREDAALEDGECFGALAPSDKFSGPDYG